jgi:phage recombination protein Bet
MKEVKKHEQYSEEDVRVIKHMIDPSNQLNDEQLQLFLHVCREKKLDPRTKQIYAIPRKSQHSNKTELTIQTSIDGFRLIAERTGAYAPGKPTVFHFNEKKQLTGATVFVKKYTKDGTWHDVSATAFLDEYMPSHNNFMWKKMPSVMIEKCAESKALRKAFPADFSGIYTDDEMAQAKDEAPTKASKPANKEPITLDEATELDELIGEDTQYRSIVMNFLKKHLKVESLVDMPVDIYKKILPVAQKKHAERKEKAKEIAYGEKEQIALGV